LTLKIIEDDTNHNESQISEQ